GGLRTDARPGGPGQGGRRDGRRGVRRVRHRRARGPGQPRALGPSTRRPAAPGDRFDPRREGRRGGTGVRPGLAAGVPGGGRDPGPRVSEPGVAAATRTDLPAPPLPAGRPRLVVTGFMGTGKTVAGRLAAARLELPFVDLDDTIQRRAGGSVPEIFARAGEGGFRDLERDAVQDAARLSGVVVATGGGAVLHEAPSGELADGAEVVVPTCDPPVLAARL